MLSFSETKGTNTPICVQEHGSLLLLAKWGLTGCCSGEKCHRVSWSCQCPISAWGGGIFFRPSSLPSQIGKTFHESLTELWRCFLLLLFVPWLVSLALSKPKLHLSTNHPSSQGGPTAAPLHRQLAPSPHLLLTWGWACCLWCLFTCRCAGGKRAAVKLEIGPGSDLQ